jgi:membrane protein EpsK
MGRIDRPGMSGEGVPRHKLNLATTIVGFCISIVTGLWFTPYLVHSLGPAAYGLIPLATTIVSYFSLLSQTLSAALTRNLAIAFSSGNIDSANRAFGTILSATGVACAALLLPLGAVAIFSPSMFQIPAGMDGETRLLFGAVALSFLLSLVSTCFSAVSFSTNRIYLNNLVSAAQTLLRLGVTVALFRWLGPGTVQAATGILLASLSAVTFTILAAKYSMPQLKLRHFDYDGAVFRGVYRTSAHQLVMQVGTVLVMSSEIVLVNKLFGHYDAGRYAAVTQWLLLLRNATIALTVLFVPTMLSLHARGRHDLLIQFVKRSMRWIGICLALPVGYLCGLSSQVLTVWLGPSFGDLWPILCIQTAPLVVISAIVPLYSISLAADRVLPSGIVQCLTGLIGIGLSLLAVTQFGAGMRAIAICVGWSLLAKEVLFMPTYAAHNIKASYGTFYSSLVPGLLLWVIAVSTAWTLGRLFTLDSYVKLGAAGIAVTAIFGLAALVLSPREDRQLVLKLLRPAHRSLA